MLNVLLKVAVSHQAWVSDVDGAAVAKKEMSAILRVGREHLNEIRDASEIAVSVSAPIARVKVPPIL